MTNFDVSLGFNASQLVRCGPEVIPDVTTGYIDQFRAERTLILIFDSYNPRTGEIYSKDPRQVAKKAERFLESTGIADTAFFAPEAEFYIFDSVRFETKPESTMYEIDSEEAMWNSARKDEGGNLSHKTPSKGGYFPVSPVDKQADLRDDISLRLIEAGLHLERSHHEVGAPGQAEINYRFNTMVCAADDVYTNHIHAEDLAMLTCAALRYGRSNRIYHATDDSEIRMGEYFDLVADRFGLPRVPRLSRRDAEQQLSPLQLSFMSESRRLSNQRIKKELHARLRYARVEDGVAAACAERKHGC